MEGGTQGLIPLSSDTESATALAACSSAPLLAVAAVSGSKPVVLIYDSSTRLRRKTLSLPSTLGSYDVFSAVAISCDGQYVAAVAFGTQLTGLLALWAWESGRLVASTLVQGVSRGVPVECSFMPYIPRRAAPWSTSPPEEACLAVVSGGACTLLGLTSSGPGGVLKPLQLSPGRREAPEVVSHAWLLGPSCGTLALGTTDGEVLFASGGYVRSAAKCGTGVPVGAIGALPQGDGVAAVAGNRVHLMQRDTEAGAPVCSFSPTHSVDLPTAAGVSQHGHDKSEIRKAVSVAALTECLIICHGANLIKVGTSRAEDGHFETECTAAFHQDSITSMATCPGRSVGLSTSYSAARGSCKLLLHSLISGEVELSVEVPCVDGPCQASLHPGGHKLALTSQSSAVLYNILADNVR